jgi:hypothetical protein
VTSLPRPVSVAIVAVGVVVVFAGAYAVYRTYDYAMYDPAFCRNCHTMEAAWGRWETSEHRTVTCHACHEASVLESARQVVTFVIRQPQAVGRHAVVPREVCQQCHFSADPRWRQVAETAGHRIHAQQRGIECVVCHAPSIHRFAPTEQLCGTCHVAQAVGERRVVVPEMADLHCVKCHEFLVVGAPLRPERQTCLQCHQALPGQAGHWTADAPHQFACGQCHKPHERALPVVACRTCHEQPREDVHPEAVLQSTPCTTCHVPHRWKIQ